MIINKTNYGYTLNFLMQKRNSSNSEENFQIEIDKKFQINIPSTNSITSIGAKQLMKALELAISLNDKKITIL